MKPPNQVAADFFAKDIFEIISRDWLVVCNGGKHGDVELAQIQCL